MIVCLMSAVLPYGLILLFAYTHSQTDINDWQMCIFRRTCMNITIIGVQFMLPVLTLNLHRINNSITSCSTNHQALQLVILAPRTKLWVLDQKQMLSNVSFSPLSFPSVFELMKRQTCNAVVVTISILMKSTVEVWLM